MAQMEFALCALKLVKPALILAFVLHAHKIQSLEKVYAINAKIVYNAQCYMDLILNRLAVLGAFKIVNIV